MMNNVVETYSDRSARSIAAQNGISGERLKIWMRHQQIPPLYLRKVLHTDTEEQSWLQILNALRSDKIIVSKLSGVTGIDPNRLANLVYGTKKAKATIADLTTLRKTFQELRLFAEKAVAALQAASGNTREEKAVRLFFSHPVLRGLAVLGNDQRMWALVHTWLKRESRYDVAIRDQLLTAIRSFLKEISL